MHSNIQIGAMPPRAAADGAAAEAATDGQDATMNGAPAPGPPPRLTLGMRERGGQGSPDKNPAETRRARVDDNGSEDGAAAAEEETKEPEVEPEDGGADTAYLAKRAVRPAHPGAGIRRGVGERHVAVLRDGPAAAAQGGHYR